MISMQLVAKRMQILLKKNFKQVLNNPPVLQTF